MATRLYLYVASHSSKTTSTQSSVWNVTSGADRNHVAKTASGASETRTTYATSGDTNLDPQAHLEYQAISEYPLSTDTLNSGIAFSCSIRHQENNLKDNLYLRVALWLMNADGTLFSYVVYMTNDVETGTSLRSGYITANTASQITGCSGKYLVIDVGLYGDPASGGGHNGTIEAGNNGTNDLPASDGNTSTYNGWVECSENITFNTGNVSAPATVNSVTANLIAPTVSAVKNQTITPAVVGVAGAVQAPTVVAVTNVTVQPAVLGITATVQDQTVSAVRNISVDVSAVAVTASVQAQTVSAVRNVSITPAVLSGLITSPAVGMSMGALAAVGAVSVTGTVQAVTVDTVTPDVTVQPAVLGLSGSVEPPTVQAVRNVAADVGVLDVSASVQSVTVTTAGHITATPAVVTASLSVEAVSARTGVTVSVGEIATAVSVPGPTMSTGQTVVAAVVTVTGAVQGVTISTEELTQVSPDPVTATLSVVSPAIHYGQTVTPAVVAGTLALQAPSIQVQGEVVVPVAVVTATMTVPGGAASISAIPQVDPLATSISVVGPSAVTVGATPTPAVLGILGTVNVVDILAIVRGDAQVFPSVLAPVISLQAPKPFVVAWPGSLPRMSRESLRATVGDYVREDVREKLLKLVEEAQ